MEKLDRRYENPTPVPDWWTSRFEQIEAILENEIERGEVRVLATSPGGRPVHAVFYGEAEPACRGKANFNSAVAGRQPSAFVDRAARKRPVVLLNAGVHGQEMEGMVGVLSAIRIMETGRDVQGRPQEALRRAFDTVRLIAIPCANPDGRFRVPYDGWVGLPSDEMHRVGQGTRRDGSLYGWPGCKVVHPMVGDVGDLGGYFDDAGVNMMHDEVFAPMSETTAALLRLMSTEAPDIVVNLHSHENPPSIHQLSYGPKSVKERIVAYAERVYAGLDRAGIPHMGVPEVVHDDIREGKMNSFNFGSAMFHAGGGLVSTYESAHGVSDGLEPFDYERILEAHHILFDAVVETAREVASAAL